jgi:hypothetical protein
MNGQDACPHALQRKKTEQVHAMILDNQQVAIDEVVHQ